MARKREVLESNNYFGDYNSENFFQKFKDFFENFQLAYILVLLVFLIMASLFVIYSTSNPTLSERVPTCGDGTFYNTCSLDKPYYCENGILVEKASVCGCGNLLGNGTLKQEDSCISQLNTNASFLDLKYFLHGNEYNLNFTVYQGVEDYVSQISRTLYYEGSEIPFRSDFKLKSISDDVQRENLIGLVKLIENLAPDSKIDQARIAISIVQNIHYGFSNKNISLGNTSVVYSRYPYEVLYDFAGICGEKSALMALLLKEIGYGVSIFYFAEENHEAVGISCPVEESVYGSGYCFVESGGPSIISDIDIEFEGGYKLISVPQVMLLSQGMALPKDMPEYGDAKTLSDIKEKNILGYLKSWKYDKIRKKYNIDGLYELG